MSKKFTRIIAGLGVVAGLGVAALPLSSYAASPDVIVSVTVGDSGAGTPDCSGTNCTIPGTNNPTGQTVTLTDRDGGKFALANTADAADNNGATQTPVTTRMIPTIGSAMDPITTDAGYGVKVALSGTGSTAYTTITPATITTLYNPVQASIATFGSTAPTQDSVFTVAWEADYVAATETGTYTNALTFTVVNNT